MSHYLLLAVMTEDEAKNPEPVLAERMSQWNEERAYEEKRPVDGKWDWYRIGGRFDGCVTGAPRIDDKRGGFNFGNEFETPERNSAKVTDVIEANRDGCYSLLLPDGTWIDRDGDDAAWDNKRREILARHTDLFVVAVDCHS